MTARAHFWIRLVALGVIAVLASLPKPDRSPEGGGAAATAEIARQ